MKVADEVHMRLSLFEPIVRFSEETLSTHTSAQYLHSLRHRYSRPDHVGKKSEVVQV